MRWRLAGSVKPKRVITLGPFQVMRQTQLKVADNGDQTWKRAIFGLSDDLSESTKLIFHLPLMIQTQKLIRAAASVLALGYIVWNSPISDDLKLQAFAYACKSAGERVFKFTHTEAIQLDFQPFSAVNDHEYSADVLARNLLSGSPKLARVDLAFEIPRDKVSDSTCAGHYVFSVADPAAVSNGVTACGKMTRRNEIKPLPYAIRKFSGEPNFLGIRSFRLTIEDTSTGEVLARQDSFQLLLGGMRKDKNRQWFGWGSSQGAKSCKLSEPRAFVLRVVGATKGG